MLRPHHLLATCLFIFAGGSLAQTTVTLREATDARLSSNADGTQLSFDLAGLIWTVDPADGTTTDLTTPELLARRPALSPDGQVIIFDAGVTGKRHLWRIDPAGGTPEQLTFGDFDHHTPVWHPDGERIAFVSNRNGNSGIWELELATLDLRQRSFSFGDERDPAYSADGERLAYVTAESDGDAVYVIGEDGRSQRLFGSASRIHAPSWRPDNSLLTFVHRGPGVSELRVVILSEPPVVRRLTRGENLLTSPAIWLDTNRFLYMADGRIRQRHFDDFQGVDINFQAKLQIPTSDAVIAGTPLPAPEPHPVRGVTGIARVGERNFVTALGDLWELDATGTVVQKLTSAPALNTQLSGSPDGRFLAYVSDRNDGLQLWLLELESGDSRQLTSEPGGAFYPAWRTDSAALAYLVAPYPDARSLTLKQLDIHTGESLELARGLPDSARPHWLPDASLSVMFKDGRSLRFDESGPAGAQASVEEATRYFSPPGTHVASLRQGYLEVARNPGNNDSGEAQTLAERGASRPQWIDGGKSLAWLGPTGVMTWSAANGEISAMPVGLSWQPAAAPRDRRLVIRAGRVFDGIGPGYEYAQDILIVGDRIEAVGPWRDPPAGELIDARDLTVLPGLLDLAVQPRRPVGEAAGRAWLAWGVTSVREFVYDPIASRERLESWTGGQRPGPRLFSVSAACRVADTEFESAYQSGVGVAICRDQDGPARATTIRESRERGLPTIAAEPFPGALLGASELPLRGRPGEVLGYPDAANRFVYGDVIEVAGAAGLVSVTSLSAIGLPGMLYGSDDLVSDARMKALLTPGQYAWYQQSWEAQAKTFSTNLRAEARTAGQSLFRAVGRGARIVTGSGAPAVPNGLGLHAELRLLRQTGLQPFQVLRIATRDAAAAIGAESDLGAIRAGLLADLVLVRGDPLADIEAAANVEATMVNGRLFRSAALLSRGGVGNFYSP